jgi:ubiquinone/menaquinone biosynthesis C-methylase UbiE
MMLGELWTMPIDFHSEKNRLSYTTRTADASWMGTMQSLLDVTGKRAADIGCGGGIYSKALVDMGAVRVTGVDFSEEMVKGASENCKDYSQINFVVGNAFDTGLPASEHDIVLERALIHHIRDLDACFAEAFRVLDSGGKLIVQDRTPEDCLLPGSHNHIRGFFFSSFPQLIETEVARRHSDESVQTAFQNAGFKSVETRSLWETRKIYSNVDELRQDLLQKTGRSILHELHDQELHQLVGVITEQFKEHNSPIIEADRWTIWAAHKA